jgi:pyrophosphatase PpaX
MPAVLFDWDGTLLDSIGLILASFRHTFTVHHGKPPPDDEWLAGVGTPLIDQLAGLARPTDDPLELLETYREHAIAHHDVLCRPFDHAVAVARRLQADGVPMAIVTSKRRIGLHRGFDLCGLHGVFDFTVCPEDVANAKPHPEPVLLACRHLGVDPADAIFVGDSPHDLAAGRAAGVRTAAAGWGPFDPGVLHAEQPDHWFDHPDELLEVLVRG